MKADDYKRYYGMLCFRVVRNRSRKTTFQQMEKFYGVSRGTLKTIDDGGRVSLRTIRKILIKEGVNMDDERF